MQDRSRIAIGIRDGGARWQLVAQLGPVINMRGSDSAKLDNALELLCWAGATSAMRLRMLSGGLGACTGYGPQLARVLSVPRRPDGPWDGRRPLTFCDGQVVGLTARS